MIWWLVAALTAFGAAAMLLDWIQDAPISAQSAFTEFNGILELVIEWGMVVPAWAIVVVAALRVAQGR